MKSIKVVFMGTPDFAVPVLEALINNYDVVLIVSQPDKEKGRHHVLEATPVKKCAIEHNIDVFQPVKVRNDFQSILSLNPDLIVTCAYGQIIPKEVLDAPKFGCINVHASLLPKLRGGAPIHKAIIDGYKETGITIMYMDELMDHGQILAQKKCEILDSDNVGTLHDKLSVIGSKLLIETLPKVLDGSIKPLIQNEEEVTFAYNIKREEEHIYFNKTAREIFNQVRGLNPWPLANIFIDDKEFKIIDVIYEEKKHNYEIGKIIDVSKNDFKISCLDGIITVLTIKPFGKKIMTSKDFLNGIDKEALKKSKVS